MKFICWLIGHKRSRDGFRCSRCKRRIGDIIK
jgi:hypothetical protein